MSGTASGTVAGTPHASAAGDVARVRLRRTPRMGARAPGVAPRAALGIVGVSLCLLCFPAGFWLAPGLVLTTVAMVFSDRLTAWLLIVYLAASLLSREPSGVTWQFLCLLAGVHLLHILAAQASQAPWRGWVQLAVFTRPLLRFVAIQLPAQAVAVVTLVFLAPGSRGGRTPVPPPFAIVGITALVALALLLAFPLLRYSRR